MRHLRPAVVSLAALTIITGIFYPLLVTGIAQTLFKHKASGSLVWRDGVVVGSSLIGQAFTDPGHFWGRPSATMPIPYNAAASSGSNLGPLNPDLLSSVETRIRSLRAFDPGDSRPVPVDLVTSSASGLDPHISLAAAEYQAGRVARARGLPEPRVHDLVRTHCSRRGLGFIGEPVVNVLELNLALDGLEVR
jgi:K+-transporting ATPase ATPase C chain